MKVLLLALLLTQIPLSDAKETNTENEKKFRAVKSRIVRKIYERITLFSKLKNCMEATRNSSELKVCSNKYSKEAKLQAEQFKSERTKTY